MKIHLHTLVYNEEKILPFFFQHYESFVDKFYIWDNKSTDETKKICKSRKDVVYKTWDSNNKMDEFTLTNMRNKIWKHSKDVDFVIVCDADEFLYSKNIQKKLQMLKNKKYTVVKPTGYAMLSNRFPNPSSSITDQVKKGIRAPLMDKCVLFSPKHIVKTNFGLGSHTCLPEGMVKVCRDENIKLLHYKGLGLEYSIERKLLYKKRVPAKNILMGISKHYAADDKQFIAAITKSIKNAKPVI